MNFWNFRSKVAYVVTLVIFFTAFCNVAFCQHVYIGRDVFRGTQPIPSTVNFCHICHGRGYVGSRWAYVGRKHDLVGPDGSETWTYEFNILGGTDWCYLCNVVGWMPKQPWAGGSNHAETWSQSVGGISKDGTSLVHQLGQSYGCHSCSRKNAPRAKFWTPDHIPPGKSQKHYEMNDFYVKVKDPIMKFDLKPHCTVCYRRQGGNVGSGCRLNLEQYTKWATDAAKWSKVQDMNPLSPSYKDTVYMDDHTIDFQILFERLKKAGLWDSQNLQWKPVG